MSPSSLSDYKIPEVATATYALIAAVVVGFVAGAFGAVAAVPAGVVVMFILILTINSRQSSIRRAHDYNWYRSAFPTKAHEGGRVSCRHCGGHRISVRNLMNNTFARAHICDQCGNTLYFSSERR